MMMRLIFDLSERDYEDLKDFLYSVYGDPFKDDHIAEVLLKQIEEIEN